jgi:hypothetical protein
MAHGRCLVTHRLRLPPGSQVEVEKDAGGHAHHQGQGPLITRFALKLPPLNDARAQSDVAERHLGRITAISHQLDWWLCTAYPLAHVCDRQDHDAV